MVQPVVLTSNAAYERSTRTDCYGFAVIGKPSTIGAFASYDVTENDKALC